MSKSVDFTERIEKLLEAGFTEAQAQAIWRLIMDVVMTLMNGADDE